MRTQTPGAFDRIVSAISYLTAGWGGMIVMVIMYFRRKIPSKFLQFNIFQSIFISLLFFVIALVLDIIMKILSFIPFINYLVAQIAFMFNVPIIGDFSLIQAFMSILIIYMSAYSLMGKYPIIWWVSKIIGQAVR